MKLYDDFCDAVLAHSGEDKPGGAELCARRGRAGQHGPRAPHDKGHRRSGAAGPGRRGAGAAGEITIIALAPLTNLAKVGTPAWMDSGQHLRPAMAQL